MVSFTCKTPTIKAVNPIPTLPSFCTVILGLLFVSILRSWFEVVPIIASVLPDFRTPTQVFVVSVNVIFGVVALLRAIAEPDIDPVKDGEANGAYPAVPSVSYTHLTLPTILRV